MMSIDSFVILLHYFKIQEARSKFEVETEPTDAINIEPSNGFLNPDGTVSLHFQRTAASRAMGSINCKVLYCSITFRISLMLTCYLNQEKCQILLLFGVVFI